MFKPRQRRLPHGIEAYRNAPSGIGPLAFQWRDKPHRLVYDLYREVKRLRAAVRRLKKIPAAI